MELTAGKVSNATRASSGARPNIGDMCHAENRTRAIGALLLIVATARSGIAQDPIATGTARQAECAQNSGCLLQGTLADSQARALRGSPQLAQAPAAALPAGALPSCAADLEGRAVPDGFLVAEVAFAHRFLTERWRRSLRPQGPPAFRPALRSRTWSRRAPRGCPCRPKPRTEKPGSSARRPRARP